MGILRQTPIILLLAALCMLQFDTASAALCKRKNILGFKERFSCPEPGQSSDMIFCCGDDDYERCCSSFISEDDVKIITENIGTILGVLFGVVIFIIVACVICCCICPCCLLYKRRHNGHVYRSTVVTAPGQAYPTQPGINATVAPNPAPANPAQAPAPGFIGAPNSAYPSQGGYPPQYPNQQPGYPMQPAPYPMQPGHAGEQPPPYPANEAYQKQAPYNPNY